MRPGRSGAVRRTAALAATPLAAAALVACGGGGGPTAPRDTRGGEPARDARRPPDTPTLLRRLLDARATALEKGDPRALAATSTGARRARDRVAARRARVLRLGAVRIAAERIDVDGDRARLQTATTYRVRGVTGEFAARRAITALRTSNGWRVRSLRGTRQRPPWEVAAFRRVPSAHFVVLAPPGVDPAAGGLLDALEAGYDRTRGLLRTGRLRRRYLVLVAADAAQARRLTSAIRGLESLAAVTDSEVRQEGPAERVVDVASQRLVVVWPALLAIDPVTRETVITHELSHAVLAPVTSGRTPGWLVEGIALYISADRRVGEAAQLVVPGSEATVSRRVLTLTGLTHPDSVARLDGEAQSAAYAYASAAAFYIADRYGQDRLLALYDAYNDPMLTGEKGDPTLTDEAVLEVLDISLATLERNLRRWIVTRAVVDPLAP